MFNVKVKMKRARRSILKALCLIQLTYLITVDCFGQDGEAGIEKATELLNGYFKQGVTLLYIIGAVVGLIGAIKVYNKWSSGDQDTSKAAASWFGACIFLVIVATALKSFFGIK